MAHLREIVASNETEAEFKMLFAGICNYFGSFRDECIKMMDQNLDDIFEYLRITLNPKKLCEEIGYCATMRTIHEITEVSNLYSVEHGEPKKVDWRDASVKAIEKPHIRSVSSCPECFVCKKIFGYVYNYVAQHEEKTDEVIIEALDKVCAKLFTTERQKCERIVNESVHEIVYYVKVAAEPDIACYALWLCTPYPDCVVCKQILSWVYKELKDNKTELSIQNALDRVCEEVMPSSKVPACKNFIDSHLQQLINIIIQVTDPDFACHLLGFCTSERAEIVQPFVKLQTATKVVRASPISGSVCDICREVFHWINSRVKNPKIKEDVIAALDEVCQALPSSKRQGCIIYVKNYVNQIIEVLSDETNPDVACSVMHLCKFKRDENKIPAQNGFFKRSVSTRSLRNDLCNVCQTTTQFLQEELDKFENEQEINNFIKEDLCDRLTWKIEKDACEFFMTNYATALEQFIAQNIFDPTICEHRLKICPRKDNGNAKLTLN